MALRHHSRSTSHCRRQKARGLSLQKRAPAATEAASKTASGSACCRACTSRCWRAVSDRCSRSSEQGVDCRATAFRRAGVVDPASSPCDATTAQLGGVGCDLTMLYLASPRQYVGVRLDWLRLLCMTRRNCEDHSVVRGKERIEFCLSACWLSRLFRTRCRDMIVHKYTNVKEPCTLCVGQTCLKSSSSIALLNAERTGALRQAWVLPTYVC